PKCRGTARLRQNPDGSWKVLKDRKLEEGCPECEHVLVEREGRFGKFVACSNYPECSYIKQEKIGVNCPECEPGELVVKRSRRSKGFYGCNAYPDCDFLVWDKPIKEPCPECKAPFVVERETKKHGVYKYCFKGECKFTDPPDCPKPRPRVRKEEDIEAAKKKAAKRKAAKKKKASKKRAKKKSSKKKAAKRAAEAS
ncbi:MAG: type I DNA topoisomerase, partial [Acidobacteriota bacterium]